MKYLGLLSLLLLTVCAVNAETIPLADSTERIWLGPDFYANRLMDWRLHEGRAECLEGAQNKPMRTAHILTHTLTSDPAFFSADVTVGAIDAAGKPRDARDTWAGLLIGAGNDDIDFRITALAHHWPAPDGGLIVAVDGTGRITVRENINPLGKGSPLNKPDQAWKPLRANREKGEGFSGKSPAEVRLSIKAAPALGGYQLTADARETKTDSLLHSIVIKGVAAEHFDGSIALCSHRSPGKAPSGYWFRDITLEGKKLRATPERAFGPIVSAQHTLHRAGDHPDGSPDHRLRMTAQLVPFGENDADDARLEMMGDDGSWETVAESAIAEHSFTATFDVASRPDFSLARPYRVAYELRTGEGTTQTAYYEGEILAEPDTDEFVVGALNCHHIATHGLRGWNSNSIWYPNNEVVAAMQHHSPDLYVFSGDQLYEGGLAGIIRTPADKACIDYLYHWYRWCWAFRDLTRDVPTVVQPDDHDVYHGNIWGAGGKRAVKNADEGGYLMDPLFVNAVHRTQVSHMPPPEDPTPIEQGITVYHTALDYGGISFAILADRMWKSSPTVTVPEGDVVNGWFHNLDFDPRDADVPEAVLLGERQLKFLEEWGKAKTAYAKPMRSVLSQTIFANVATLPEGGHNDKVVPGMGIPEPGEYIWTDNLGADCDSNGWPQTGRNKAVRLIKKARAFQIAGDQHLSSFIQYGVEEWRDGGYAFCAPAIGNTWPRRWFPPEPGANREADSPPYTGDHHDGFGNKITVFAVANPVLSGVEPKALYDRMPGYGIVRFDRTERSVTAESWPRWVDPSEADAQQFEGWPITVYPEK